MKYVSITFRNLIMVYAIAMLVWGVLGFIEYFTNFYMIVTLQNGDFPKGTQFLHWLLITLCGFVYIYGDMSKWRHTPVAMSVIFGMMASMCFIQTFDFMTNSYRYLLYVMECFLYILISSFLFLSR